MSTATEAARARMWAPDEDAAAFARDLTPTTVLVSSRDGAPVPRVKGAMRLERKAVEAGWVVRQTYALAEVPDRPRKAAHRLHSVAVRLSRRDSPCRGWAVWHREGLDDSKWRFVEAWLGVERHTLTSLIAALSEP